MKEDIEKVLENYKNKFPHDPNLEKFFEYLKENVNCTDRKNYNGHITVSALVVKDKKILLLWHKTFEKLMQPGGHIDPPDKTIFEAIIREVKEETGLDVENDENFAGGLFSKIPITLDVHPIALNEKKQEDAHFHYDMFFYLKMKDENQAIKNVDAGVDDAQWVPIQNINETSNRITFKAVTKYKTYL